MMNITCLCGCVIGEDHPKHRGFILNEIASLRSKAIQMRDQLSQLNSRRNSKQFQKQHNAIRLMIFELERELPIVEGTAAGMAFRERELYDYAGGKHIVWYNEVNRG